MIVITKPKNYNCPLTIDDKPRCRIDWNGWDCWADRKWMGSGAGSTRGVGRPGSSHGEEEADEDGDPWGVNTGAFGDSLAVLKTDNSRGATGGDAAGFIQAGEPPLRKYVAQFGDHLPRITGESILGKAFNVKDSLDPMIPSHAVLAD